MEMLLICLLRCHFLFQLIEFHLAYPPKMDLRKVINAGGFHVKSSDLQLPVKETRSGPQHPFTGRSQQVGFSKTLHYVSPNLSVRDCLAGLQLHSVAPSILQTIINHGKNTSLLDLQNTDG